METWGVFGGAFDPPHLGHLMAAASAIARGPLDRLLIVPTYEHPLGKTMAPWRDRVAMARIAFEPLDRAEVSEIESRLAAPSRTLATLRALRAEHPSVSWRLVVGADVLAQRDQWHRFDEVAAEAHVLPIGRAGHPGGATPDVPDVNSTWLRRALAAGDDLRGWLDPKVEAYIRAAGLYGTRS